MDCVPLEPKTHLKVSPAVFEGKVLRINKSISSRNSEIEYKITRTYKGKIKSANTTRGGDANSQESVFLMILT